MGLPRARRVAGEWLAHPWVLGPAGGGPGVLLSLTGLLEVAELKIHDVLLRLRGPIPHRREVVVVDVSEKTFDELDHAWPFPRAWFAQAIETIQAAKPKAIGLDILFLEPSVFGPADDDVLSATLKKYTNVVLGGVMVGGQLDRVVTGVEGIGAQTHQQIKRPIAGFRD